MGRVVRVVSFLFTVAVGTLPAAGSVDVSSHARDPACAAWSSLVDRRFDLQVSTQSAACCGTLWQRLDWTVNRIRRFAVPGSVVLDIGAHLGVFSEMLLMSGANISRSYLFEPVQRLFHCQVERLSKSKASRSCASWRCTSPFRLLNFAFGEEDMKLQTIKVSSFSDVNPSHVTELPSGWNTLANSDPGYHGSGTWDVGMESETVLVRTLSDFLEEETLPGFVSVIKIDVEGHEGSVFRGALPWLAALPHKGTHLPVLIIEVAWGRAHPQYTQNLATYQKLEEIGYCPLIEPTGMKHNLTVDVVILPRRLSPECNYNPLSCCDDDAVLDTNGEMLSPIPRGSLVRSDL